MKGNAIWIVRDIKVDGYIRDSVHVRHLKPFEDPERVMQEIAVGGFLETLGEWVPPSAIKSMRLHTIDGNA